MTEALEVYKSFDVADVFKSGRLAARLARRPDGSVEFGYIDGYDGRPVARTLPVQGARIVTPGGAVPAFFAGLLPEGRRLTDLRRARRTSPDDELTVLMAVGADTPGDVQIVPAGEQPRHSETRIDGPLEEVDFRELADAAEPDAGPGVPQRASAVVLTCPPRKGPREALLKVAPADLPGLVRNEAEHLAVMRRLRIPVTRAQIVTDRNGVEGLLMARVDRTGGSVAAKRLEMEDAAQLLGVLPADKYRVTAEDASSAILDAVSARPVAARNLLAQFLFAWLSGNGDLHAKNLAVLRDSAGTVSVAPVQGALATAAYSAFDLDLALPIAGRASGLRWAHWEEFASGLGVPGRVLTKTAGLVLRALEGVDLAAPELHGSALRRAVRELRHRRDQLPDDVR